MRIVDNASFAHGFRILRYTGNSLDTRVFIFSLVSPSNPVDSPLIDDGEAALSGGWFGSSSSGDAGRDRISRLLF